MEKLELKHELNNCSKLLSSSLVDYLDSLIELEISVLRDYITDEDKEFLRQLSLYKNIEIYNIYNRALQILKTFSDIDIYEYNTGIKATIRKNEAIIPVYTFDFFKPVYSIHLQEYIHDDNDSLKEKTYILNCLKRLNDLREKMLKSDNLQKNTFLYEYDRKIESLSIRCRILSNVRSFTDSQKKIVDLTNTCSSMFYEEYGLSDSDFKVEKHIYPNDGITLFEKKLIKQKPGVVINNSIKYI